jgi:hypothetical protein
MRERPDSRRIGNIVAVGVKVPAMTDEVFLLHLDWRKHAGTTCRHS